MIILKSVYSLGINFLKAGIFIASFFNKKAKENYLGRKKTWGILNERENLKNCIWVHCASLGEFEQGRPIIEKIKNNFPNQKIVLSFFSSSGYNIRKNYAKVNAVFYLPLDLPKNAKKLISLLKPKLVIFVKSEFWFNYIFEIQKNKIPHIVISSVFNRNQYFFKKTGEPALNLLSKFDYIFVQNDTSKSVLVEYGLKNVLLAGDTRIDRVKEISEKHSALNKIENFIGNCPAFICGSTWIEDENLIFPIIKKWDDNWKIIIAPHNVNIENIKRIRNLLQGNYCLYSDDNNLACKIMIIDNIGLLNKIYKYGQFAYIGGGFGEGIHNTLEPIAHKLPVIFGPKYKKFPEATFLIQSKGGFSIQNQRELQEKLNFLKKENNSIKHGNIAYQFIETNMGASDIIYKKIQPILKKNQLPT